MGWNNSLLKRLFRKSITSAFGTQKRTPAPRHKRRLECEWLEKREVPAAFTPGDIVVYRVGDGVASLTNNPTNPFVKVFLDEYSPTGTLVQSIQVTGTNFFSATGTDTSQGLLSLSTDGTHLVMMGFQQDPTAGIATINPNYEVGIAAAAGTTNTATALTAPNSGNAVLSAASTDGTSIWFTEASVGVDFTTAGTNTFTSGVTTTTTSPMAVSIQDGQLEVSSRTGTGIKLGTVGAGTPTGAGQTTTNLPGFETTTGSPNAFFFARLNASSPGPDTLYVADSSAGIQKWTLASGTWSLTGTITAASVRGLTGTISGTTVTLYGTTGGGGGACGGTIYSVTDTAGYNAAPSTTTASSIATAATNEAFRGIALAPQALTTTTTTVVNTPNAGGIPVFTATVKSGTTTDTAATGTITFKDETTGPPVDLATVAISNGVATLSPSLTTGTHIIVAVYSGDNYAAAATYGGSISAPLTSRTTTVEAANQTATFSTGSQPVTLSATVTSNATVNAGTVTFSVFNGATQIGTSVTSGTVAAGVGTAAFTLPAGTLVGTYTIQVSYSGGGNFSGSNDFADTTFPTLTVGKATTSVEATAQSAAFSTGAQSVTLHATVSSTTGANTNSVNEGVVVFSVFNGATQIGSSATSGTVVAGAASASYTLPAGTAVGSYSIHVSFATTSDYLASSNSGDTTFPALTVGKATTSVEAMPQGASFGQTDQSVTLSATVSSSTGSNTNAVNEGVVVFSVFNGATQIGSSATSGTVSNGAATATYTLPANTPTGTYSIHVSFAATTSYAASSNSGDTTFPALTVTNNVIFNGGPGYSQTNGWNLATGVGYNGSLEYTQGGDGSTHATWQVTGLASGYYAIQATWNAGGGHATNAPFMIFDGSTLVKTVLVNQQPAPTGGPTLGGVVFQTLIGQIPITSGTLNVEITSKANGYVIANAVNVFSVPAPTVDLNWTGGGITGPTTADTSTTFTITRNYNIAGSAAPSSFNIGYYASTDTNFAHASLLGTETISAPADMSVGLHSGTSPALQITGTGTFFLFARLNDNNAFLETDSTNNVAQAPQSVTVTGNVSVVVDNGGSGFSSTAGWNTAPGVGYGGTLLYAPGGNGTTNATYTVTGLQAGYYTVEGTWNADAQHATNAPYEFFDGSTLLSTVAVNQVPAPSGGSTQGGVPFQVISTVHVTSGTLNVEILNSANGYVIADAVHVFTAAAPTLDLNWTGGGITGPTTGDTSTTFTISRTYNIAGGPAPSNFTIGYYASTDTNFAHAFLLGTETISGTGLTNGLHSGTSPAFQFNNRGTYFLFARLNDSNTLTESDNTNNVAQAPQSIVVTGATIVDNGGSGFSQTSGWNVAGGIGYGGSLLYAAGGDGTTHATWTVTGLAAGSYIIEGTWNAGGGHASNAPFQFFDGTTPITTVLVNQQAASTGGVTQGGVTFQTIATVTVNSGTLNVEISSNANGYVIADAIYVTPG